MAIKLFVPLERNGNERRVALCSPVAAKLKTLGVELMLEPGAGDTAGFPDRLFPDAKLTQASDAIPQADVVFRVTPPPVANVPRMRAGSVLVAFLAPHKDPDRIKALRDARVTSFSMELVPRISRAQAMDALSSQAAAAGYKAALLEIGRAHV